MLANNLRLLHELASTKPIFLVRRRHVGRVSA